MTFSTDGRMFAWSDSSGYIDLLDLSTGARSKFADIGQTLVLAFDPDGTFIAVGHQDGRVCLYRLHASRQQSIVLGPFDHAVLSLSFDIDGQELAAGDSDGHIQIWNIARLDRRPIILSGNGLRITGLAFGRDERITSVGEAFGETPPDFRGEPGESYPYLLTWPTTKQLADIVCKQVRRNLTRSEWLRYFGSTLPYEKTCSNLPEAAGPTRIWWDEM